MTDTCWDACLYFVDQNLLFHDICIIENDVQVQFGFSKEPTGHSVKFITWLKPWVDHYPETSIIK